MATLAALELQRHVQTMSGARLPIVTGSDASLPVKIYVGKSPTTEKLGVTDKELKFGAYRIATGADWVVLLGVDRDFEPGKMPWPLKRNDVPRRRRRSGRRLIAGQVGRDRGDFRSRRASRPTGIRRTSCSR